jgi:hypothetical protein
VRTVPLVTLAKVPAASFLQRLWHGVRTALIALAVLFALVACTLVALRVRVLRRQRASSAR